MRISLLYALLDGSDVIRAEYLKAALSVWSQAEYSAAHIFNGVTSDPTTQRIVDGLAMIFQKVVHSVPERVEETTPEIGPFGPLEASECVISYISNIGSYSKHGLEALSLLPWRYNPPVMMVGQSISHYKLVSQLGEGGMDGKPQGGHVWVRMSEGT